MVETTTIKSRRFLVTVYLFILLMVTVIVTLIILIFYEQNKLIDTDIERYDVIIHEINRNLDESSLLNRQIEIKRERLSELEITSESRISLISDLIALFEEKKVITAKIDSLYSEILSLNLPNELILQSELESIRAESAVSQYDNAISTLRREAFVTSLQGEINDTISCYNNIRTEQIYAKLKRAIDSCDIITENTITISNSAQGPLPVTKNYLLEVKRYWEITLMINEAIDRQNESVVERLNNELQDNSASKTDYENRYAKELQEYIQGSE